MTVFIIKGEPSVIDVVLVPSPYPHDYPAAGPRPVKYFEGSHRLADDLWLADLCSDFSSEIFDACQMTGKNFSPTRQFGAPYGFIRTNVPKTGGSPYHFDHDHRLLRCIAISRLIHPTSVGFEYSARVRRWPNGHYEIVPYRPTALNPFAYVADPSQDWLIPDDVHALRELLAAFDASNLPERVNNALWHFETVARTYYIDVRWPLLVTALESLVHIRNERDPHKPKRPAGSTRVFSQRVAQLATRLATASKSEKEFREIYDRRSTLAHGQLLGTLDAPTRQLYIATEEVLRAVLRECIANPSFASTFENDAAINLQYPLS
jgi:hypothetical protein